MILRSKQTGLDNTYLKRGPQSSKMSPDNIAAPVYSGFALAERGLDVTRLYGRDYRADELFAYVGQMAQVAGVQRFELTEGKAKGVRCARVYTGSGFEFLVVLDRAMDIALATCNGAPLNWYSQVGITAPEYYEPALKGWDRTFFGGLNTTCGLRCAGHDSVDLGEPMGLHGRISCTPAEDVNVTTEWRGDEYVMEVKGLMREAHAYRDNVIMTRTISTRAGAKSFVLRDEVTNEGADSTQHLVMYHVNPGFPVLTEKSKILWSIERSEGTTEEEFVKFVKPPAKAEGGGYFWHKPDAAGKARAACVNPDFDGGKGLGVYIEYDLKALPVMVTWKQMARHAYCIGIEPANARINTNAKLREQGLMVNIEPGEKKVYEIEFGALSGSQEIEAFRAKLPK